MRFVVFGVVGYALVPVSVASAQTAAPPVQRPMVGMSGDAAGRMLEERDNLRRLNGDVAGSLRQFRARLRDVVAGSEVRDSNGLVVGTIAKVDSGFAVVAGPLGSVEVDVGSIAKNRNGLLINLPKAKIDAMMARQRAVRVP